MSERAPSRARIDDRQVVSVIESGVVFGTLDRALERLWRAGRASATAAAALQLMTAWRDLRLPMRRFAVGLTLVVAVAVHILLTLATDRPPGWWWLILPGICTAIGALLLAASSATRTTTE